MRSWLCKESVERVWKVEKIVGLARGRDKHNTLVECHATLSRMPHHLSCIVMQPCEAYLATLTRRHAHFFKKICFNAHHAYIQVGTCEALSDDLVHAR